MGPNIGDKQQTANKIGEGLLGTCDNDPPEWFLNDPDLCAMLDDITMRCECCGWWVEPCELDDDQECEDCQ